MLHPLVKNKEKDTVENAVISIKKMEDDIKLLKDTVITSKTGAEIWIKHTVIHSMHDGKNRYVLWFEILHKFIPNTSWYDCNILSIQLYFQITVVIILNINHSLLSIVYCIYFTLHRKAWTEEVLRKLYRERIRVKKWGGSLVLDNNTCMICLSRPTTYNSRFFSFYS